MRHYALSLQQSDEFVYHSIIRLTTLWFRVSQDAALDPAGDGEGDGGHQAVSVVHCAPTAGSRGPAPERRAEETGECDHWARAGEVHGVCDLADYWDVE